MAPRAPVISIIVAASSNDVIGAHGVLPWRLSDDLRRFKARTLGKPIVMGRRTFESIGRPLPGRRNIVLTRQSDFAAEGCEVVSSPAKALDVAGDVEEIVIIGGSEIYALFLPVAHRLYLTRVHGKIEGDAYFPAIDADRWRLVDREAVAASDGNEFAFEFRTYERQASAA